MGHLTCRCEQDCSRLRTAFGRGRGRTRGGTSEGAVSEGAVISEGEAVEADGAVEVAHGRSRNTFGSASMDN